MHKQSQNNNMITENSLRFYDRLTRCGVKLRFLRSLGKVPLCGGYANHLLNR